jgi:ABC-type transport system substrate-binding protein
LSAIILQGKIEPGGASQMSTNFDSDALLTLDYFWRSDANQYPFVARPAGIDNLIDKAKSARDDASRIRTTQDIVKLLYDDETIIPLWVDPRIVVVDKSVQNDQFFINGHPLNNRYDKVWLKK